MFWFRWSLIALLLSHTNLLSCCQGFLAPRSSPRLILMNRSERIFVTTTRYASVPVLEDWTILPNGRVQGVVRNHPEIKDGSIISTSPIPVETWEDSFETASLQQEVVSVETTTGTQYLLMRPTTTTITPPPSSDAEKMSSFAPTSSFGETFNTDLPYFPPPSMQDKNDSNNKNINIDNNIDDDIEESSSKQLMQQVKDAGVAGIISYALWEFGFWTVSVPVCIVAYRQVTGHWPDLSNSEDLQQLGAEAFAFVNVARFAVPLRIGLALSTTPWIQANIVDRFSKDKSMDSFEN